MWWRRIALAALLLVTLTFPAGCWDQREVEQLGIVLATAVDKGPGDQLEVHVQVVIPRALAGGGMGGMGGGGGIITRPYRHYSATGATVFEAMRQLSMEAPRRLFYAHNQVILIDEGVARERLREVLDFFDRSTQIRRHVWVLVTKPGQIHGVLTAPSPLELMPAQRLVGMIRERSLSSRFAPQRLGDFVEMLEAEGQESFTALAVLVPTRPGGGQEAGGREGTRGMEEFAAEPPADIRLSGAAVFLGDRMVGALDERETRGLLWVRGEVRGGSMTVPCGEGEEITVEILRSRARIEPRAQNGPLGFVVEIRTEGNITESHCRMDLRKPETLEVLSAYQAAEIAKEVEAALTRAKTMRADVFGFGATLHCKMPGHWHQVKEQWHDVWPKVAVDVRVEARLRRTGLINVPLEPR